MDEPRFTSTRTDAESYAEHELRTMPGMGRLDNARRSYIRDALAQAFESGEHQGVCRAIIILAIAKGHARTAEARAALDACLRLLVDEPE